MKWKENLIALKEKKGFSYTQIAHGVDASESTVKRVFSLKREDNKRGHSIDLVISIILFLGGTASEIFEDTGAMVFGQNVVALQESLVTMTAERDEAIKDNISLKTQVTALTNEILNMKLAHKDEIIELYKLLYHSKTNKEV